MITERSITDIVLGYLRPLRARIDNAIARGVVKNLDDTAGLARGQSTTAADQVADDIEFVTPYGISFRPAAGAETIVWSIGGFAGHLLGMIFDRRIRLKATLAEGEVALHIGNAGQVVHLKADGSVEVRASDDAGGSVVLTALGDVIVTPGTDCGVFLGDGAATKRVALADDVDARLADIQAKFDAHVHPGVVAGPGSTAVTVTLIGPLAPTASDNVYGKG